MRNKKAIELTTPINWDLVGITHFKQYPFFLRMLGFTRYYVFKVLDETPIQVNNGWTYKVEWQTTTIYWCKFKLKTYAKY